MIRTRTEIEVTGRLLKRTLPVSPATAAERAERNRLYDHALEIIPLIGEYQARLRVYHLEEPLQGPPHLDHSVLVMNRAMYDTWRAREGDDLMLSGDDLDFEYALIVCPLAVGSYRHPNGNMTHILVSDQIPDYVVISAERDGIFDVVAINYMTRA